MPDLYWRILENFGFDAREKAEPFCRTISTTQGYSCEQIHESITGILPRKHEMEITARIYIDVHSLRMDNLEWVSACGGSQKKAQDLQGDK